MNSTPLIEAKDLSLSFGTHSILEHVGLSITRGEIVSLIGPNGSGKTTLVRVLLGLQKPEQGRVNRAPGLTIGYMPQRLTLERTLPITVGRFLTLGVPRSLSGQGRRVRALDEVGAGHIMETPLQDVSGGELQRVLLARALLREPGLLVLDEPVQGVDVTGQADLYRLIGAIRDSHNLGVLMVSHDLHVVMAQTDRVICLNRHVCCAGKPEAVGRDPAFQALFGPGVAESVALYHHEHDHRHDVHGEVVAPGEGAEGHAHVVGRGDARP